MKNITKSHTRKTFSKFVGGFVVGLGVLTAGAVQAAVINATTKLGAGATDNLLFESSTSFTGQTHSFSSLIVGKQGVGGVTFFNGTIVNSTVRDDGSGIPVTFGDDMRIDGRLWRGATAGPEADGSNPFAVNDNFQTSGSTTVDKNLTVKGSSAVTGTSTVTGASTLTGDVAAKGNLTVDKNATVTGKLTVAGIEIAASTLTNTDVAETITANWVNTANPWASNEIADVGTSMNLPVRSFYNVDGTNGGDITGTSVSTQPALVVSQEGLVVLRWTSADTDPAGTQLQVPSDYASGGSFKLAFRLGATVAADNDITGKIWVVSNTGSTQTITFTNLTGGTNFDTGLTANTAAVVTLTLPTTVTLKAGDHASFTVERAGGTDNVDLLSADFEYTAVQ